MYTTFFVGLREDKFGANLSVRRLHLSLCASAFLRHTLTRPHSQRERKPHYHILFSVSYGLSRTQLAQLCHDIDQGQPERFELEFGADAKRGGAFRPVRECKRMRRGAARGGYTVYDAAVRVQFSFRSRLAHSARR